jgi:amidophosphoribosyltransferase
VVDDRLGKPGEECGVFGVYAPGEDAAQLTYFGIYALQHRGQESAGICVSDGETATVFKDLGLVSQVFDGDVIAALPGHLAIGHTRYSTSGSTVWRNAQPVFRQVGSRSIALGHNGNLTNTVGLARDLGITGVTDSEVMVEMISRAAADHPGDDGLVRALEDVLPRLRGAFSIAVMDQRTLIGVRDPFGFRPMCLGRLDGGWVLASETAALDIVGATFERELEAGEMVAINADGVRSLRPFGATSDPRLCIFEFVYFARPDSRLYAQDVHGARVRMGRILAAEQPVEADVVVPVPESGIPAAQGFAEVAGIPYEDGLMKNRYVGRTFIQPTQLLRDRGIRLKLNPIRSTLEGRRVVLVDDSIVRGSTTRQLVQMVREAGATEVHLRVSAPPYKNPSFYGMDTVDQDKLIASRMTVPEIREHLDADSLGYLSIEGLTQATGAPDVGFCDACLTGDYPTEVPVGQGKFALEQA